MIQKSNLIGRSTAVPKPLPRKPIDFVSDFHVEGKTWLMHASAARLMNTLSNPDITVIEPNPQSVSYQPGNTLIGAGIYDRADIMYDTKNFMPKGVNWIQDKVVEFDPDNNKVITATNKTIGYDFLVVAAGLKIDFGKIKGLEELQDKMTLENCKQQVDMFGNSELVQCTQQMVQFILGSRCKDSLRKQKVGKK